MSRLEHRPAASFPPPSLIRFRLLAGLLVAPVWGMATGNAFAATALDLQVNHQIHYYGNDTVNPQDGPVGGKYTFATESGVNGGAGSVTNAVLTQMLPEGAIFLGIDGPAGVICTGQPAANQPIPAASPISCTFPTLEAGTPQRVDFNVILPTKGLTITAVASLASVDNVDGNSSNNNNIDRNITLYERADLSVKFTGPANGSTQQQGTVVNYTIQASNANSPYAFPLAPGEKAELRFALPAGTSWQDDPVGDDWSCLKSDDTTSTPPTSVQTCTYTATSSGIAKGEDLPLLTIPVTVTESSGNTDATVSVSGQNSGGIAFIDSDPDNNNDKVGITFAPNTELDMKLEKSVAPSVLDKKGAPSQDVTYTMKATRNSGGMLPSGAISITDTLPAGVTYTAISPAAKDAGWDCGATGQTLILSCNFTGAVNGDGSLPDLMFTAAVNVGAAAIDPETGNTVITNTASLDVENEPPANKGPNNQSSANLTISDKASLRVEKSASQTAAIKDGTQFHWTIKVTNTSDVKVLATNKVTVTDVLDPKLAYVEDEDAEAPWNCSASPVVWKTDERQTVTCTLSEEIAKNAFKNLKIKVEAHIPDTTKWTTVQNTASAICPEGRTCPGIGTGGFVSNQSSVNLSEKVADLSISKSAEITPDSSSYGAEASGVEVEYTLNVKNALPAGPLSDDDFQTARTVVVEDVITNLLNTDVSPDAHPVTGTPRYSNERFVEATYDTVNGVSGSCAYSTTGLSANQVRVTCTLNDMLVGETVYPITIKARQFVNPTDDANQTATITNTATVKSPDTAEYDDKNNVSTADVTLTALTNLKASKTATPIAALAGQPVTYTIGAQNQGPSAARVVTLVDTLPVGMIWVTAPSIANGSTCTLSGGGVIAAGAKVEDGKNTLTCAWPADQAFGVGTRTITYTLRSANTDYPATVTNDVQVETATQETIPLDDPNTDNKASQIVTLDKPQLDVRITMEHTADRLPINSGASSRTEYTIKVMNSGASTSYATNVQMLDKFPAAGSTAGFVPNGSTVTSVVSIGKDGKPTSTNRFDPSLCTFSADGLACNFPWLAPGESAEIKFEMDAAEINNGDLPYGTIRHEASVSADGEYLPDLPAGEDVMDNNKVTDRTSAYDAASGFDPDELKDVDLSIVKTSEAANAAVGDTIAYRLTVKNEETATPPKHLTDGNAKVTDVLPEGLELVLPAPNQCTYADTTRTLECTITDLNQGESVAFDFSAKINVLAQDQMEVINTATVTSPGDPNPSNNHSEKKVPSTPSAVDLSITKTSDTESTQEGGTIAYRLTVKNEETATPPNDLKNGNAKVTDVLPEGLELIQAVPDQCTYAGATRTLECTVTDLNQGESVAFDFIAKVNVLAQGQSEVVNTATVTSPGDPNPGNNQSKIVVPSEPPTEPSPPPSPTPVPSLSAWALMALSMLLAGFALRRMAPMSSRR
jgi:uncharacterized repeat protein (TIGR01451 family)/fimbrial isopeptide formation D2 family protein